MFSAFAAAEKSRQVFSAKSLFEPWWSMQRFIFIAVLFLHCTKQLFVRNVNAHYKLGGKFFLFQSLIHIGILLGDFIGALYSRLFAHSSKGSAKCKAAA